MGPSFPPLAEALDLGPSPYSPWLVESAALLGGEQAYRGAARLRTHFTGVTMRPSTIRRMPQATGATFRQLELVVAATVRATGTAPDVGPDVPLQLRLDGSLIPLRDEGWREVKVLAIGERAAGNGALTHLT